MLASMAREYVVHSFPVEPAPAFYLRYVLFIIIICATCLLHLFYPLALAFTMPLALFAFALGRGPVDVRAVGNAAPPAFRD